MSMIIRFQNAPTREQLNKAMSDTDKTIKLMLQFEAIYDSFPDGFKAEKSFKDWMTGIITTWIAMS